MNCHEFEEKLDGLIDEELPEEEQRFCREHTEICSHCREKEMQYRRMRQAALASSCQAPTELMPAVTEKLKLIREMRRKHWVGALASAAAVALLMAGGYAFLRQSPVPVDSQLSVPGEEAPVSTLPSLIPTEPEFDDTLDANIKEDQDSLREPGAIYPFVVQITCPAEKLEEVKGSLFEGIQSMEMGGGRMICRADLTLLYQRVEQDPYLQCEQSIKPLPEATALDVLIMLITKE